jgi:hypothetical protein
MDQRRPTRDVIPVEHPPQLTLDRLDPERKPFGDLGVAEALGNEGQDLGLARGW